MELVLEIDRNRKLLLLIFIQTLTCRFWVIVFYDKKTVTLWIP